MQSMTKAGRGAINTPATFTQQKCDGMAFPPLEAVTRPTVGTPAAAYYLNRQQQTLRGWACSETFPDGLRPVRVNGRLAWPVAGIRRVLGVAQ